MNANERAERIRALLDELRTDDGCDDCAERDDYCNECLREREPKHAELNRLRSTSDALSGHAAACRIGACMPHCPQPKVATL